MLNFLIFCGIGIIALLLGAIGFVQIIFSINDRRRRGIGLTVFTTSVWTIILVCGLIAVIYFIPQYQIALYIGYAISLCSTVKTFILDKMERKNTSTEESGFQPVTIERFKNEYLKTMENASDEEVAKAYLEYVDALHWGHEMKFLEFFRFYKLHINKKPQTEELSNAFEDYIAIWDANQVEHND